MMYTAVRAARTNKNATKRNIMATWAVVSPPRRPWLPLALGELLLPAGGLPWGSPAAAGCWSAEQKWRRGAKAAAGSGGGVQGAVGMCVGLAKSSSAMCGTALRASLLAGGTMLFGRLAAQTAQAMTCTAAAVIDGAAMHDSPRCPTHRWLLARHPMG